MKLEDYLNHRGEKVASFARRLGLSKDWSVRRYLQGARPCPRLMVAIYLATNGMVQPNDFYDLPRIESASKV